VATFPGTGSNALGVKVELLLNSVWTDITSQVRLRNPVQITDAGRADWTSTLQAAQLTLTINNRGGNFTPKNTAGANYPYITRNVQIRVSVNATSVTAVAYSGYRFWGEVTSWPPTWDVSSRDVWCDITAAGIWRRMSQLETTLGSAFTRYNAITLTGTSAPRAYWPMEDGTGSGQLVSYDSVAGTGNAVQSFTTGQAGLSLAACTDFKGSDGIPQLNAAAITATVPAGGTATNNVTRFLISVPTAGDSASGTTNWNISEIDSAGTVAKFEVYLLPAGTLTINLRNSGGTVIASGTTTTNVHGKPVLASCELTPSGSNVAFAFRIITPGATGITESLTGTLTSASAGAISKVVLGRANVLMDTAVGHLSVTYGAVPSMVAAASALGGYVGEFALDRFTRICGEMGITAETIGTSSTSAAMGPQVDDTLTGVLQSIEDTDMGLLFESRTQFGLGYRTLTSMANQSAAATISYPAAILDPSLAPVYDDQLTRNNVTITNWTGYTQQAILTAGTMSILNPPSGIGNGYAYTRSVNAAADSQVAGIATWLLNVGSVDEVRFPVITIRLAKAAAAALFAVIPGLRPGDYLQITSPPSFLTASTIRQLTFGYSETIGVNQWDVAYNAVPESPYETGFSPGTVQTAQLPGSGAVTSTAPGAGGLGGVIVNGSITPAMLNEGITIHTLGGSAVTISASAPATPNTGDIWIASATGLISQWNGTTWVPFKFDGTAAIQAASITAASIAASTIVASNIAGGTITAALLAAGIVVAGIVNGTTITGATIVADGTAGEILVYSGVPASGNLIGSWSGSSGTDGSGNPYAQGLEIKSGGLVLDNQASGPTAVSAASVIYSSTGGRPRYLSAAGADSIIERSTVNVSQFTVGNTATLTNIAAPLGYLASEAALSSEFEIEISGNGSPAASGGITTSQLVFDLLMDGVSMGASPTIGATFWQLGTFFAYTLRFFISVTAAGASGTAAVNSDGSISWSANKTSGDSTTLNAIATGVAVDWTANHTFQVKARWTVATGTGSGSQQLTTYRTKLTRRD
jgi:hypothetical protein